MRFTSLLLAIPLIGSAFAAPAPKAYDLVDRTNTALDTVVAVFTDLRVQIDAVVPHGKIVAKADVEIALGVIVESCTSAIASISADVELKAKLALLTTIEKKIVAKIIADVIVDVNVILQSIDASLCLDVEVKALIASCNSITAKLFLSIEAYISGVLKLALNICASLKISISPLFTCLTVSLKAFLGGVLNLGGLLSIF